MRPFGLVHAACMDHLLEYLLRPTVLLPAIMALALARLWRKRREKIGRLLWVTIPLALLTILSIPAIAYVALGTLEWQYPPASVPTDSPIFLVVMGSSNYGPEDDRSPMELSHDMFYRCMQAVSLYQRTRECKILVSGGLPGEAPRGPRLARAVQMFFLDQGIEAEDLTIEARSQNTHESAMAVARILHDRGVRRPYLITDARHMNRAVLCLRKEGVEVTPVPCNFLTNEFRNRWEGYLPSPAGAARFQEAFHEWLALAYYWWKGWI